MPQNGQIFTFLWTMLRVAHFAVDSYTGVPHYESKQTSLTQDLKWLLEQRSALYCIVYHWRQTELLLCTILLPPPSSSKHVHRRSRPLLYSISMDFVTLEEYSVIRTTFYGMNYRRHKQKKLISKILVDSSFAFSSYAWLCVFHCSHRLLCCIKSCVRDFQIALIFILK